MIDNFKFWCQKVMPLVYDDSLSYYETLCKLSQKLNEVINAQNDLQDNVTQFEAQVNAEINRFENETNQKITDFETQTNNEINRFETDMTNKFQVLKDYVDSEIASMHSYIETQLPILTKEETDKLLNQWKDDGTLRNLINSLLGIIVSYETTLDMLSDPNLTVGMIVETLGYANANDGGGAKFNIVNSASSNEFQFKINDTLYASLITDIFNVLTIGVNRDGKTLNDTFIEQIVNMSNLGYDILFPQGNYLFSKTITFSSSVNYTINGNLIFKDETLSLPFIVFNTVSRTNIYIHSIETVNRTTFNGWTNTDFVGIKFIGGNSNKVKINSIFNFTRGFESVGDTNGQFNNTYDIGIIWNCKDCFTITTNGTNWSNDNVLNNLYCAYQATTGYNEFEGVRNGILFETDLVVDTWKFNNISFDIENNISGSYYGINIKNSNNITFNYRCELVSNTNVKLLQIDCSNTYNIFMNPYCEYFKTRDNITPNFINLSLSKRNILEIIKYSGTLIPNLIATSINNSIKPKSIRNPITNYYTLDNHFFDNITTTSINETPILYNENFSGNISNLSIFISANNLTTINIIGDITSIKLRCFNANKEIILTQSLISSQLYFIPTTGIYNQLVNSNTCNFTLINDVAFIQVLFTGTLNNIALSSNYAIKINNSLTYDNYRNYCTSIPQLLNFPIGFVYYSRDNTKQWLFTQQKTWTEITV